MSWGHSGWRVDSDAHEIQVWDEDESKVITLTQDDLDEMKVALDRTYPPETP